MEPCDATSTTTLFLNFLAQQVDACKDGKSQLDLKHFFRAFVSWAISWCGDVSILGIPKGCLKFDGICPFLAGDHSSLVPGTSFGHVWTLSHLCGLFLLGVARRVMDTFLYHSFHPSALLVFQSALKQKQWPLSPEPLWTTQTFCYTVLYLQLSVKARSNFSLRSWIERNSSYLKRRHLSRVCDKWVYFVWWSYQNLCHQQDRQSSSFISFNYCKTFALRRSRKPFAAYARTLSTKGIAWSLPVGQTSVS